MTAERRLRPDQPDGPAELRPTAARGQPAVGRGKFRLAGDGAERKQKSRTLATHGGRSLLLTVLGQLVEPAGRPVRTSAVINVLSGLGVQAQTARQAIARTVADGWVVTERQGREVHLALASRGTAYIKEVTRRASTLSAGPCDWDHRYLIIYATVNKQQNDVRRQLHSALGSVGFGYPKPGLWVNPNTDRAQDAATVIDELELRGSTIAFIGTTAEIGLTDDEIVERGWDLGDTAAHYEQFIATHSRLEPQSPDQVLRAYLMLVHEWQQMAYLDPRLPECLIPDWIGSRASVLFDDLCEKWVEPAYERWREIVDLSENCS